VKKTWRKKAAPVQPVLDLYNYAKQNNIAIFLITERPTSIRAITIRNLKRAGYRNWDGLYTITATNPKTQAEQDIQRKGYEIILNISDQESDIAKSTAEMKVKLPNYMYVE
jgi:predicted secreted acid phosphatase